MTATLGAWNESLASRWADITDYSDNPVEWVTDKLREFMWSQQRAILESLQKNRYTAVHSAHDLGKSKVAANAISWWIDSHPPGEAFVVSTAPTAAQVSSILWREISKNMTKNHKMVYARDEKPVANWDEVDEALSEIIGKITQAGYPKWKVDGELVGYGRKPADYEESAFQGIHARYVLIVVDEACGVAKHLFDAVDALATNEFARVLAIGNPDDPGSHFASVCKPGSDWNVIHLDGLRSPNITKARVIGHKSDGYGYDNPKYPLLMALMEAEGIPYSTEKIPESLNDLLVSELWIEERIRRWGGISAEAHLELSREELQDLIIRRCAASPLFLSKVRGIFPTATSTGVIPLGWVQLAVNRWHDVMDKVQYGVPGKSVNELAIRSGIRVLGVDVAGEGEDETAFAIRYGSVIEKIERYRMSDTMETANAAASHLQEVGSMAVVDTIGIGSGVYDRLREMGRDPKTTGVLGSAIPFTASKQTKRRDAIGEYRFRNDRAAAWWNLRQMLDPSRGSIIALPDDDRLIEELVAVRYKHNVGGVIQIESKEEIRKRLGRSTDTADAVIQAFWVDGYAPEDDNPAPVYGWQDARPSDGVIRYPGYEPYGESDLTAQPGDSGPGFNYAGLGSHQNGNGFDGWDL